MTADPAGPAGPADPIDPIAEVAGWLPGVPGLGGYFPVMSLATTDLDGGPDVRTVLLSEITPDGLTFHTDARSRKVAQVSADPSVALLLTVPEQGRQIVAVGTVAPIEGPGLKRAYLARSRYLQLLAWMNTAEIAALPESERHERWADFSQAHPEGELPPPPGWAGFLVVPRRITFWQADSQGPSHRVEYTRTDGTWTSTHHPG